MVMIVHSMCTYTGVVNLELMFLGVAFIWLNSEYSSYNQNNKNEIPTQFETVSAMVNTHYLNAKVMGPSDLYTCMFILK